MIRPSGAALLLACALGCGDGDSDSGRRAVAVGELPPSDDIQASVPAGAIADDLREIVRKGLETPGKGPDFTRFVVIRAGDRHGAAFRERSFHVLVGAGLTLPDGSMRIRHNWNASGRVHGRNEEPERAGISVCIEPDAPRPFSPAIVHAVSEFCRALAREVPLHPDLVLAMEEIPRTLSHEADEAERALAAAARKAVPVPPAQYRGTIVRGDGTRFPVTYELADTEQSRGTGMMLRRGFNGADRGMLFEYPHRRYLSFYMRNCFIPIDVAYIREGRIEDIYTMAPQAGMLPDDEKRYNSTAAVKYALELPGGWFDRNGVRRGDRVEFHGRAKAGD